LPGWKGYLIAGFALVWVANFYMSLFALLRQAIKAEKTRIELDEKVIEKETNGFHKQPFIGKRKLLSKTLTKKADHWKDI